MTTKTNSAIAIGFLAELTRQTQLISELLRVAHAEGRDLNEQEMQVAIGLDDAARARLVASLGPKT